MSNAYTSPFTGDIVQPTDVSYYALNFSANVALAWPAYIPANSTAVAAARIMQCSASAANLTVALPPGSQGSTGQDILFVNKGLNNFVVTDYSGQNSVSVPVGQSVYFYLSDNTTTAGVWNSFVYGTGTSAADAATLAGNGLSTSTAGKLQTTTPIIQTSVAPTFTESSRAFAYIWNGGLASVDLPTAASIASGWFVLFRNNGTGAVTFFPQGTSTVNGTTSVTFAPGDSGSIIFDSTNNRFYTVGLQNASINDFSAATYDVDSIVGSTYDLTVSAPTIQTYTALSGSRTTNLLVELPAVTNLYVFVNNTNQSTYTLSFQISGSSQTPLVIGSGSTAMVLSDGTSLYLLTQVGAGQYIANSGTAGAPSFAFSLDTTTGMYLYSTGQLGLAANGSNIMILNNSNPSAPVITAAGRLTATLISGGTF